MRRYFPHWPSLCCLSSAPVSPRAPASALTPARSSVGIGNQNHCLTWQRACSRNGRSQKRLKISLRYHQPCRMIPAGDRNVMTNHSHNMLVDPSSHHRLCAKGARAVPSSSGGHHCLNDGTWLLEVCPLCSAGIHSPDARFCSSFAPN